MQFEQAMRSAEMETQPPSLILSLAANADARYPFSLTSDAPRTQAVVVLGVNNFRRNTKMPLVETGHQIRHWKHQFKEAEGWVVTNPLERNNEGDKFKRMPTVHNVKNRRTISIRKRLQ